MQPPLETTRLEWSGITGNTVPTTDLVQRVDERINPPNRPARELSKVRAAKESKRIRCWVPVLGNATQEEDSDITPEAENQTRDIRG